MKKVEIGHKFSRESGEEFMCYDVTDRFAFIAPVELSETKLIVLVDKTLVYQRDLKDERIVPMESLVFDRSIIEEKTEEKAE